MCSELSGYCGRCSADEDRPIDAREEDMNICPICSIELSANSDGSNNWYPRWYPYCSAQCEAEAEADNAIERLR